MDRKISIKVGPEVFAADFYDSELTRNLVRQFPMTVSMDRDDEGQGDYFAPLDHRMFGNSSAIRNIMPGDITLYNSISLSIFCDVCECSGNYVRLGHINNPDGLRSALKKNSGFVTFSLR